MERTDAFAYCSSALDTAFFAALVANIIQMCRISTFPPNVQNYIMIIVLWIMQKENVLNVHRKRIEKVSIF